MEYNSFNLAGKKKFKNEHQVNTFQCINLQDWDIIVDLGAMFLSDAFSDPNNVSAFLFLQLQIGIENSEMELLHECVDI